MSDESLNTDVDVGKSLLEEAFPDHDFGWRSSGTGYLGSCPHHVDRHPSFSLYVGDDDIFRCHCFSCGKSGKGIIGTIAFARDIEFREAIPIAVEKGLIAPSPKFAKKIARDEILSAYYEETNELLMTTMGKRVRDYVVSRGIPEDIIPELPIGLFLDETQVNEIAKERGWDEKLVTETLRTKHRRFSCGSLIFFYRDVETGLFTYAKARYVLGPDPKEMIHLGTTLYGKGNPIAIRSLGTTGYFGYSDDGLERDDSYVVMEGEFDVLAGIAALYKYKNSEDSKDIQTAHGIYSHSFVSFGGGGSMYKGVDEILKRNSKAFIFPDMDKPGMEYMQIIINLHPYVGVIIPEGMEDGMDPNDFFNSKPYKAFDDACKRDMKGLEWEAHKLAVAYNGLVDLEARRDALVHASDFIGKLRPIDQALALAEFSNVTKVSAEVLHKDLEDAAFESKRANSKYFIKRAPAEFGTYTKLQTKDAEIEVKVSNVVLSDMHNVVVDYGQSYDSDNPGSYQESSVAFNAEVYDRRQLKKAEVVIPASDFAASQKFNAAVVEKLGGAAVTNAKDIEKLRESLIELPNDEVLDETYRAILGFNETRDKFYFADKVVTANGIEAFTDTKVIAKVDLVNRYAIGNVENTEENFQMAIDVIIDKWLKALPYHVSLPIFVFTMASVLYSLVPTLSRPAVLLLGETNTFKTEMIRVILSIFGNFCNGVPLMSWTSTHTAVNETGFYPKDLPYGVDDCKAEYIREQNFISILQAYGDKTGRTKCTIDSSVRSSRPIQGALIMTGETLPANNSESAASRMAIFKLEGSADEVLLTECQLAAAEGILPLIGARWVQYVINQHLDANECMRRFIELRNQYQVGARRTRGTAATLMFTWELLKGFIPRLTELDSEFKRAVDAFSLNMSQLTHEMTAGVIFLNILKALIAEENLIILAKTSVNNIKEAIEGSFDSRQPKIVGWYDNEFAYVLPSIALERVQDRYYRHTGNRLSISAAKLYDELFKNHLIVPDKKSFEKSGAKTSKQRIPWSDSITNVLRFHLKVLIEKLPPGILQITDEEQS